MGDFWHSSVPRSAKTSALENPKRTFNPLLKSIKTTGKAENMTASELAHLLKSQFQSSEVEGRKTGLENIQYGVIEHSDVYEVVGYTARQSEPNTLYDGLSLRISFILAPTTCIDIRLLWTSWMADPTMAVRADYPPIIVKQKSILDTQDPIILKEAFRFCSLLRSEIARGCPPNFIERLWIRVAK